jgi:lipopolysaccharide/colanic/teichoic acid biosynthesis glycosyltransferase
MPRLAQARIRKARMSEVFFGKPGFTGQAQVKIVDDLLRDGGGVPTSVHGLAQLVIIELYGIIDECA